ncbi:MAG: hypothetical protein DRJ09_10825 [Bacteroidetes bacterium]|nr:MAG: hypothetical protein DRJ09_10825 [Bacteroidota bacterium]
MKKTICLLLFQILAVFTLTAQLPFNNRYYKTVFDSVSIDTSIVYGNAPALTFPYLSESNTFNENLLMDIYQPYGDTLNARPLVICVHSGAFLSGSRKNDDMIDFCDLLAHRGYVAATIDYRLGMNILSTASSIRAVYRGLQDGRAAVRFFKEFAGLYKIDTNQIYLLGSSAGSFIGLQNMFMDTEVERPPETFNSPDLGCLDCSGNSYSHSGKANAVVSLWGAVEDTTLIVNTDSLPLFLAHGKADNVVYFDMGHPFGYNGFPETYGSLPVSQQKATYGFPASTYFVKGVGHEFYGADNGMWGELGPNAYWDTVFAKVDTFFYKVHKPQASFSTTGFENIYMFFDKSTGASQWHWDFGDGTYSDEANPAHEFEVSGSYTVVEMVLNDLTSWDTTSTMVDITISIDENPFNNIIIYPNPTTDMIVVSGDFSTITLLNQAGHEVRKVDNEHQINIANLPVGIYFVKVVTSRGVVVKKLVKR